MHRILIAIALLVAPAAMGATRFVAPVDGAQVFGPMLLEVETDASHVDRVEFHVDGTLVAVSRKPPYRARFDFGESLAPRRVVAHVYANGFRDRESAEVTTAPLSTGSVRIDVDLVEVPLRVRASRPLAIGDLTIRENGAPQTILEIRERRPPAHFIFVVDRSLSMGDGKLDAALRAVDRSLRHLRPGDTASIVLFNHRVASPLPLGKETIAELQQNVRPSGGTSLRDAVASVSALGSRVTAIVISDGSDRNSLRSEAEALRRTSGSSFSLYALTFGDATSFVRTSVETTGGRHRKTSAGSIARDLDALFADINSRFVAVYQSASRGTGWRTIAVRSARRGVDVLDARRGYFAE